MDLRNSALVVALYLSGAVLVIGTAWAYLVWQRPADVPKLDVAEGTIELDRRPVVPAGRYAATVSRSSPTLAELQAALTVTRGKLDQTTLALHRKSAECRALKVELDNSLMMLANLLADEGGQLPDDAGPQRDAGESRKSVQDKLASELERVQLAVGKSEQLDAERERQLAQLQDQLMQADVELDLIQEEARRAYEGLADEKRALEDASLELAAHCGAAAVPHLIRALSHERVEIRRWAVRALGAIGGEATDAWSALHEMLLDPDEAVRSHAATALTALGEARTEPSDPGSPP